jgi:F-type H+-transporting ATPase subunit b
MKRGRLWGLRALSLASVWLVPVVSLALEGEAHHAESHGEHGWDTTGIAAQIFNFFALIAIFVYLFKGKLNSFLKQRKAEISDALNEATRLKAEAAAKHREYSERLAKLDQELAQIKQEMIAAGIKERDRIVAEAEHKAARMRREAEFIVEQQVKQLHSELTKEAVDAAVSAASELLLKTTTSYDHQRLAQDYLAALSEKQGAAKAANVASFGSESHA